MSLAKVNIKKLYFKIAVKTPILVISVVLITTVLLYYFSITSTLGIFKKFEGEIKVEQDGSKYIETQISAEYSDYVNENNKAFWYINKEKAIYNAYISKIDKQNEKLKLAIVISKKDMDILDDAKMVYVDIEAGKETLLDRLFKKGADNYGTK